ncbi:MAG: hypothetical protein ACRCUT_09195, partial [Spirochaetota bacterium]
MLKNLFSVISLLFIIMPAYAGEEEPGISFSGTAGIKSIIAYDELGGRSYLKPFASAGITSSKIDAAGEYFFWKGYTITYALFNEKEIDIHQTGGNLTVYPSDIINISGSYYYFSGDLSYSGHKFTGLIDLYLTGWSVSAEYSGKLYSYDYTGEVKNAVHSMSITPEYGITDNLSIDLSYECTYTDYKSYGYTVTGHTLRAGLAGSAPKSIFILGGLSTSMDTNDLFSAGADCSVSWKI